MCSYRWQCLYLHQREVWGLSPFSDTMMGYVHPVTTALCSEQTVWDITPSSKSSRANWTACRGHIFVSVHFSLLPFLTTLAVSTSWPMTWGVLGVEISQKMRLIWVSQGHLSLNSSSLKDSCHTSGKVSKGALNCSKWVLIWLNKARRVYQDANIWVHRSSCFACSSASAGMQSFLLLNGFPKLLH